MAITTTTITPPALLRPYSGLGEIGRSELTSPRGEVRFNVDGDSITAGGVGNEQRLHIQMLLPLNYAYALTDANVRLKNDDAGEWDQLGRLSVSDSDSTGRTFVSNLLFDSVAIVDSILGLGAKSRIYNSRSSFPAQLLVQVPGHSAPKVSFFAANNNQNDLAGTCEAYFRFLMYDVDQAYHAGVNNPSLIRS